MSARTGTFFRVKVSDVSRDAAISGKAAFLAPPIGITPSSGTPPLMQILSIASVAPARRPHRWQAAAYLLAVTPPSGCFYLTAKRRSSRRLAVASLAFFGWRCGTPLLVPGLLLAPPQIVAQRLCQTLLALCVFSVVLCAGL